MFKGGIGEMLQQASKMRGEMQRIQEELATKTVEGSAGGGMGKVVANGKQQIVSVTIDPSIIKSDNATMIQDLVRAGTNDALKSAQEMVTEEMSKLTGGLGPLADMFKGSQ